MLFCFISLLPFSQTASLIFIPVKLHLVHIDHFASLFPDAIIHCINPPKAPPLPHPCLVLLYPFIGATVIFFIHVSCYNLLWPLWILWPCPFWQYPLWPLSPGLSLEAQFPTSEFWNILGRILLHWSYKWGCFCLLKWVLFISTSHHSSCFSWLFLSAV